MYANVRLSRSPLAFGNLRVLGCPGPFTSAVSREIKARPPPGSVRLVSVRVGREGFAERVRAAWIVLNRGRIVSPLLLRSVALLSRREEPSLSASLSFSLENLDRRQCRTRLAATLFFKPQPLEQWRKQPKCSSREVCKSNTTRAGLLSNI